MLQDEHFALLRRQLHQGALNRAAPFTILHRPIGPFRRGDGELAILDHRRRAEPRLAPPLGEAPVSQDQEEPPREILRVAALRELIEGADERILHRVFGSVGRAQHPRRIPRVAIAVAMHEYGVPVDVPRQHTPNDAAV